MNRLIFHPTLCVGCFACELACKGEHQLSSGIRWIQVERVERIVGEGKPQLSFQLRVCQHCESAPCVPACPVGAIFQKKGGFILLDGEKCNGCQECLKACPWRAIAFDSARQTASKCNLCVHQAKPRCVTYCPSGALTLALPFDSGLGLPSSEKKSEGNNAQ